MSPTREQVEAAMAYGEYRLTEKQWGVLQLGSGECMDRRASMYLAAEVRRLESQVAELEADKARLDWLEANGGNEFTYAGRQGSHYSYEIMAENEDQTIRAAIDAARKGTT